MRTESGAFVLVGDGIKVAKEASRMPGVKKLHQESENSGKPSWILGHHFGIVGLLGGRPDKVFCIPLAAELHEGAPALRQLQAKKEPVVDGVDKSTVVTLMAHFQNREDSSEFIDWKAASRVTFSKLKPSLRTISLRLPEMMIEELKLLANKMDVPYQTLTKIYLSERIQKELKSARA